MKDRQASFLDIYDDSLSISEAAAAMSASSASVRNWIKTGYLQPVGRRHISRVSFDDFQEQVIGSDKLTARANKLRYDYHDHHELKSRISGLLNHQEHTADSISGLYEASLSQSYRNLEGVYYTPRDICDLFFLCLPKDRTSLIFLDPCCGTGNFLLAAIRAGFKAENVYGCDVDETAIDIARKRMQEATHTTHENIFTFDFLGSPIVPPPDVIFTNPPWGKKLAPSEKERLATIYSCNKSLDTSAIFLLACRRLLVDKGYYGMLMPESFYNVASFEAARRVLLTDQIASIVDHAKPFAGILSRAVSFVAIKQPPALGQTVKCLNAKSLSTRKQSSFLSNPALILNYVADNDDAELIQYLYTLPHLTLAGRAKWALGIVTGNNKRHLSTTAKEGLIPVYRGVDIEVDSLRLATNFISTDMSAFQQVAPKELYEAPEKLIYRFISSKLVFYHDTNQSMILNSANLVIPDEAFPVSMKVLARYLSSDFMNWVYGKIFSTHKVLRSDIERLPIFADQLITMQNFDEQKLLQEIGIKREQNGSYRIKK